MDNRDLQGIEIPQPGPDMVQTLWDLQAKLVEEYKVIEALPDFPLNLDIKAHQALIKDFIGRVVEELAEGYEHFKFGRKELGDEELADVLHFLLELLIFVHPSYEDFKKEVSPDEDTLANLVHPFKGPRDEGDFYLSTNPYWAITYYLNLARNSLRNKPWKQTEIRTRKEDFFLNLYTATRIFFRSFWPYRDSYKNYVLKNRVNMFRIKSKY